MIARALHYYSHRAYFPFQMIDGARPEKPDESCLDLMIPTHPALLATLLLFHRCLASYSNQLISIHRRKEYKCSHSGPW